MKLARTRDSVDLAVICVTHDSVADVVHFAEACGIAALGLAYRLVFVDSGSKDATIAVARTLAEVVDLGANRGYAAGINAGVDHVRMTGGASIFVVANPDVRADADALAQLNQALQTPGRGIAAPTLRDQFGTRVDSLRRKPSVLTVWADSILGGPRASRIGASEVLRGEEAYATPKVVGWATGGILAISGACMTEVGPWDEEGFMYEEEVDFCLRAASRGWCTWYEPRATAMRHDGEIVVAPWRQALMRRNRIRRVARQSRAEAICVGVGLAIGDLMRVAMRRPEARAALWAVLTMPNPQQILARYGPRTAEGNSA